MPKLVQPIIVLFIAINVPKKKKYLYFRITVVAHRWMLLWNEYVCPPKIHILKPYSSSWWYYEVRFCRGN